MFDIVSFRGYFRQRVNKFTSPGGVTQVCNVAPTRALLVVSCSGGGSIGMSMNPNMIIDDSVYFVASLAQQEIWWERHGLLVTQDWYVFSNGPVSKFNCFELFWEPQGNR